MINCFDGEFRFLSNMFPLPTKIKVAYDGTDSICRNGYLEVDNIETAYQAGKVEDVSIFDGLTGKQSKKKNHKIVMSVEDFTKWNHELKFKLMERLLRMKFSIPELKEMLLSTGDEQLIEGNYWHDICWGVCEGIGENHLGKMLMKIREELKQS